MLIRRCIDNSYYSYLGTWKIQFFNRIWVRILDIYSGFNLSSSLKKTINI